MAHAESVALFFFAHQDDEFGAFQKIVDEQQKGHRVCCAYLTDGGFGGVAPQRRNRESLYVLGQLGVQHRDVFFAGQSLVISDARLHEHLESASKWISVWIDEFSQITSICVPAWEGGHHDHDVLHAVVVTIAQKKGLLGRVKQFALYNGYECVGPLFRVLAPLPMNGAIEEIRIPWKRRLRFLRYCLCYPSQAKTWLGLFPFVAFRYFRSGKQMLQPVSFERLSSRPHEGRLYYEKRGFFTWEQMVECLCRWDPKQSALKHIKR